MNRSILVVDDDLGIREALRAMLNSAGYKTEVAVNGEDALQKIGLKRYDLITMDMAMANMDGVDTVSVIRTETETPILVISAYLNEALREELNRRKRVYFLEKPFTLQQVLAMTTLALQNA